MLGQLRRRNQRGHILPHVPKPRQPAKPTANRRQRPRRRSLRQPALVQHSQIRPNPCVLNRRRLRRRTQLFRDKRHKSAKFPLISPQRVRRRPALVGQHRQVRRRQRIQNRRRRSFALLAILLSVLPGSHPHEASLSRAPPGFSRSSSARLSKCACPRG